MSDSDSSHQIRKPSLKSLNIRLRKVWNWYFQFPQHLALRVYNWLSPQIGTETIWRDLIDLIAEIGAVAALLVWVGFLPSKVLNPSQLFQNVMLLTFSVLVVWIPACITFHEPLQQKRFPRFRRKMSGLIIAIFPPMMVTLVVYSITMLTSAVTRTPISLSNISKIQEVKLFPNSRPEALDFNYDGSQLAVASDTGIYIYNMTDFEVTPNHIAKDTFIRIVTFSPDGRILASSSPTSAIWLWDMTNEPNKVIASLEEHSNGILSLAFSPDGTLLASGSWDNTVKIWNTSSHKTIATLQGHTEGILSVTFSHKGTLLASAGYDGVIRLWNLTTMELEGTLPGTLGSVESLAFSPDDNLLVSGGSGDIVYVWDVTRKTEYTHLEGHTSDIHGVAFDQSGDIIVTASHDDTMRIWDLTTKTEIASLTSHDAPVFRAIFNPDNTLLASSAWDHTIRLWGIEYSD